jgi:hypothetical protein
MICSALHYAGGRRELSAVDGLGVVRVNILSIVRLVK